MVLCIPLLSFPHVNEIWLNPHRQTITSFFFFTEHEFLFFFCLVFSVTSTFSFMFVSGPVHDKPFLHLICGQTKKKGLRFGKLFFGVGVNGWFL